MILNKNNSGNNQKRGKQFEDEFAEYLHGRGFWVYQFPNKVEGQPCDIIAVKSGEVRFIDCKTLADNLTFPLERVEVNQEMLHEALFRVGCGDSYYYAISCDDGVRMVPVAKLMGAKYAGEKSINLGESPII